MARPSLAGACGALAATALRFGGYDPTVAISVTDHEGTIPWEEL